VPAETLPPTVLCRRCAPAELPFETTAEATDIQDIVGQDRAVEAVRFGIAMQREGYNLFAVGPPGVGKQTLLRQLLGRQAATGATPADWVYVHNFSDPHRPRALKLATGMATKLRGDMDRAIGDLQVAMRAAFESEEHRTRKQQLVTQVKEQQESAFTEIQERAKEKRIAVIRTDTGIFLAPLRDGGAVLEPADFQRLPAEEQKALQEQMDQVGVEIQGLLRKLHDLDRQHHEALAALDRETAASVAHRIVGGVCSHYQDVPAVLEHLSDVEKDVVDNAGDFFEVPAEGLEATLRRAIRQEQRDGPPFRRYRVNVLVDNGGRNGAPVIYEDNPTHANLVGRLEHVSQLGALVTDFTLIKAGALHRASGGFLLIDALKVLQHPFAWDALKRAIRCGEVRMEPLGQALGLVPTISIEPAPIPLDRTKVVLFGERWLYYQLATLDPDFLELFKVLADFDDSMPRRPESQALYARLIATLVRREQLRPFHRGAVARVVEYTSRLAGDAEKLSVHMRPVVDLLREADLWAGEAGRTVVSAQDVEAAIDAQLRRAGRMRERLLEAIRRETILIDTSGEKTGQVNGLAVTQLGEYLFGHPTRITARVRAGKGEVIDIEREVELGGPIHSKGVLILSGFLGSRYAPHAPLSLTASLVFEQSYGPVEGDSASLAEACALLSALAEMPVKQCFAVTGSINQHGQVQAIGGVNEKIEGFFDVCRDRGLTGGQGVLIPRSNVQNLMLRRDVVEAVERGQFAVFAVADVDEAIEILAGRASGVRDRDGKLPKGSVNEAVEARLIGFAESSRRFLTKTPG
jgi:lon-related putative ATP-dependent protease